jgi:hypothetical protein
MGFLYSFYAAPTCRNLPRDLTQDKDLLCGPRSGAQIGRCFHSLVQTLILAMKFLVWYRQGYLRSLTARTSNILTITTWSHSQIVMLLQPRRWKATAFLRTRNHLRPRITCFVLEYKRAASWQNHQLHSQITPSYSYRKITYYAEGASHREGVKY